MRYSRFSLFIIVVTPLCAAFALMWPVLFGRTEHSANLVYGLSLGAGLYLVQALIALKWCVKKLRGETPAARGYWGLFFALYASPAALFSLMTVSPAASEMRVVFAPLLLTECLFASGMLSLISGLRVTDTPRENKASPGPGASS